jgi:hypothetical protein
LVPGMPTQPVTSRRHSKLQAVRIRFMVVVLLVGWGKN